MLDIADFLLAAERALGIDAERLIPVTKIPLAESALAAPYAAFGGHEFYPHPVQQAAILASRIMRNHPLPDGNKRVALLLAEVHLAQYDLTINATPEEINRTFRAIAAKQMTEDYFTIWLQAKTMPPLD